MIVSTSLIQCYLLFFLFDNENLVSSKLTQVKIAAVSKRTTKLFSVLIFRQGLTLETSATLRSFYGGNALPNRYTLQFLQKKKISPMSLDFFLFGKIENFILTFTFSINKTQICVKPQRMLHTSRQESLRIDHHKLTSLLSCRFLQQHGLRIQP